MEKEFNIPMLNNEQFNRDNIEIIEFYWTISYARDTHTGAAQFGMVLFYVCGPVEKAET